MGYHGWRNQIGVKQNKFGFFWKEGFTFTQCRSVVQYGAFGHTVDATRIILCNSSKVEMRGTEMDANTYYLIPMDALPPPPPPPPNQQCYRCNVVCKKAIMILRVIKTIWTTGCTCTSSPATCVHTHCQWFSGLYLLVINKMCSCYYCIYSWGS